MVVWRRVLYRSFRSSVGFAWYSSLSERTTGRFSTNPRALRSRDWLGVLIFHTHSSSDSSNREPPSSTVLVVPLSRCQSTSSEQQQLDTKPSAVGCRCHTALGFVCVFGCTTDHDPGRCSVSIQASQGNRARMTTRPRFIGGDQLALSVQHDRRALTERCQRRRATYRGCILR